MNFSKAYPLLVVLLAVFAIAPLEYPGTYQSHTGLSATYNLINLDQNLTQFGWAPTFGHAYDLFRTEGVLPYLIAECFHLIGFGFLDAIKLVYALAWILSGLTMYVLALRIGNDKGELFLSESGAFITSIVYMYLPYHIATVYVRGAFAESVAWAVMPIALGLVLHSNFSSHVFGFKIANTIPPAIAFAILFLIQPGIAVLFALITFAITLAFQPNSIRPLSSIVRLAGTLLGGLGLGALLTLPSILRNGVNLSLDAFNPNFVYPFQLFASLWGYGTSTGSFLDQFPFQIGVVPIGLAIVAVALGWRKDAQSNNTTQRFVIVSLVAATVIAILTFEITKPLWNILGLFVAYPWQLLAFVGFALALAAGAAIELDERFKQPAMLTVFIALPIIASYSYLAPNFIQVNPTRPAIATFNNNEIAMLDYRIVGPLRHGATLRVDVVWQALRPIDYDYTIFLHAVNADGNTYGQSDAKPKDGALPTLKWAPGQIVKDTYTIQIDVDGPIEGYHLEFGMYKPNGTRAVVMETGSEAIILPRPGDPEPIETDQLPPAKSK